MKTPNIKNEFKKSFVTMSSNKSKSNYVKKQTKDNNKLIIAFFSSKQE